MRALLRGQQFIWSNPDEAAAIAAGVLKTDVALAKRSLAEAIRLGILDPKLDWSELGLQRIYENMQADGAIPAERKFDLGKVTDAEYLRAAQGSAPRQIAAQIAAAAIAPRALVHRHTISARFSPILRSFGSGENARCLHACTGRRVLCVFPRYTPSFGTFEFAYPLTDGVRAFMPPQGLLVIAAAVPPSWQVRFIDENMAPATDDDFAWAEVVFVSGMHVQRRQIDDIAAAPMPSTGSRCWAALRCRPARSIIRTSTICMSASWATPPTNCSRGWPTMSTRPPRQIVLTTKVRRELSEFPIPAYELAQIDRYLLGSIQFSSGCPYQCEFCDIPALYGRVARYKTAEQVCAELDKLVACGLSTSVYFVDDNFIANKRAVREMLPHLIEWQKRNGYPLLLSCEATLNIAKRPEILELMREAAFTTIFCGIETPDPEALQVDLEGSQHDGADPRRHRDLERLRHGGRVGHDHRPRHRHPRHRPVLLEFVEQSQIPMLTMNLLQALPRTPLWDRLKREHRLIEDDDEPRIERRCSGCLTTRWWRCGANACASPISPKRCSRRYEHQIRVTYANRCACRTARSAQPGATSGAR